MKKIILLIGIVMILVITSGFKVEKTIESYDGKDMWDGHTCRHMDYINNTTEYSAPFKVYKLFGIRLFRTYLKEGNGCSIFIK